MDVRAENRRRPHQKVCFLWPRYLLSSGHPAVRVRNVHGKSGPKGLCACCFFFPDTRTKSVQLISEAPKKSQNCSPAPSTSQDQNKLNRATLHQSHRFLSAWDRPSFVILINVDVFAIWGCGHTMAYQWAPTEESVLHFQSPCVCLTQRSRSIWWSRQHNLARLRSTNFAADRTSSKDKLARHNLSWKTRKEGTNGPLNRIKKPILSTQCSSWRVFPHCHFQSTFWRVLVAFDFQLWSPLKPIEFFFF